MTAYVKYIWKPIVLSIVLNGRKAKYSAIQTILFSICKQKFKFFSWKKSSQSNFVKVYSYQLYMQYVDSI